MAAARSGVRRSGAIWARIWGDAGEEGGGAAGEELLVGAGAHLVEELGDDFFAGAGLAGDEGDAEVGGDALELGTDGVDGVALAGETGEGFERGRAGLCDGRRGRRRRGEIAPGEWVRGGSSALCSSAAGR